LAIILKIFYQVDFTRGGPLYSIFFLYELVLSS